VATQFFPNYSEISCYPSTQVWVRYQVYCVCFCSVTVYSAGTPPIGVKFGKRRRQYPHSQAGLLMFWGRYPQGRRNCGLCFFLGRRMEGCSFSNQWPVMQCDRTGAGPLKNPNENQPMRRRIDLTRLISFSICPTPSVGRGPYCAVVSDGLAASKTATMPCAFVREL